jgi:hypothetical protein
VLLAITMAAALAPAAGAHSGDPHFRSVLRGVSPRMPGLRVQVLGYDNQFQLINDTGQPVVVLGYENEPYARVLPDGAVQVNQRSPATYLNEERLGDVPVPRTADPKAPPEWKTLDGTGRFIWHDHRMHWMSTSRPPQVRDPKVKVKVFDYRVPIEVGARRAALVGSLYWMGEPGGRLPGGWLPPVAFVVASLLFMVFVRRRRARGEPDRAGDADESDPATSARDLAPTREAW